MLQRFQPEHQALSTSRMPELSEMMPLISAGLQDRLGLFLGANQRSLVYGAPQRAVLVLGPPRQGKTTSIIIPQVLSAPGPVVATSTRLDVFNATAMARGCLGQVWIYDPTGTEDIPPGAKRLRWSPITGAKKWRIAMRTARAMVDTAKPARGAQHETHWNAKATMLLAPLLHVADITKTPMRNLVHWVARRKGRLISTLLDKLVEEGRASRQAQDEIAGLILTPPEERGSIWSTCSTILDAYKTDEALASCENPNFYPTGFVKTYGHPPYWKFDTVYITAPSDDQRLVAPLIVAFIESIRHAAEDASHNNPLERPVSLILDEAANIAPIPTLPKIVSVAGGSSMRIVAAFQDLSQARNRWGSEADGFLTTFGEQLILPGIKNKETLSVIRTVLGDYDREMETYSENYGVHQTWFNRDTSSRSWQTHRQAVLSESEVSQGPGRRAMWHLNDQGAEPLFMTPWYGAPPWPAQLVSGMEFYKGPPLPIPDLKPGAFTNGIQGLWERYNYAKWAQEHGQHVLEHRREFHFVK